MTAPGRKARLPAALLLLAALYAGLAAAPAARAQAPEADCPLPSDELTASLVRWIGARAGYEVAPVLADPPEIGFCEAGDPIPYGADTLFVEPHERGFYDRANRRITLVLPWSESAPRDVAVLLHELVHDIQFLNRSWDCPAATEWEAYSLQARWLGEQGIDTDFDWAQIALHSRCPGEVHP